MNKKQEGQQDLEHMLFGYVHIGHTIHSCKAGSLCNLNIACDILAKERMPPDLLLVVEPLRLLEGKALSAFVGSFSFGPILIVLTVL